jgi:hypothetical protein
MFPTSTAKNTKEAYVSLKYKNTNQKDIFLSFHKVVKFGKIKNKI